MVWMLTWGQREAWCHFLRAIIVSQFYVAPDFGRYKQYFPLSARRWKIWRKRKGCLIYQYTEEPLLDEYWGNLKELNLSFFANKVQIGWLNISTPLILCPLSSTSRSTHRETSLLKEIQFPYLALFDYVFIFCSHILKIHFLNIRTILTMHRQWVYWVTSFKAFWFSKLNS